MTSPEMTSEADVTTMSPSDVSIDDVTINDVTRDDVISSSLYYPPRDVANDEGW